MIHSFATHGLRVGVGATVLAVLSACSMVPEYRQPATPVATDWPDSAGVLPTPAANLSAAGLPWQAFVQDASLRELIGMALDNNRDLRIAVQNIEQARAAYQVRRADQVPNVGLDASGQRSAPNPARAMGGGKVASNYSIGLGLATWELDFFGRVAALKDMALAEYLATEETRKAAQISVVSNVMSVWLQLKTDTELLALAERTLATREQSLSLIQLRFDHGASSALELRSAESLIASAQAARAEQQRLRAQDVNLLTLLVGETIPATLIPPVPATPDMRASSNLEKASPVAAPTPELPRFAEVPAGLPSDLLLRRPDVRAAELQLMSANANIGAARANFFPRISLTGSLGRVSADLDGLLGSGGHKAWSFGPGITLPIFDAGRNQANLDAAHAAEKAAVARYEQAVQSAFREAADALAARGALADQLQAMKKQSAAERDRLRLVDLRFRNGIANHLDLLDAQRSLFGTEQALAQIQLAQRVNEVELYKALGGGWTEATMQAPADDGRIPAIQNAQHTTQPVHSGGAHAYPAQDRW